MKNGRCRMHGGKSTGARSESGRKRISEARWKHGAYSKETAELRNQFQQRIEEMRQGREHLIASLKELAVTNPEALRRSGLLPERVLAMKDLPMAEVG